MMDSLCDRDPVERLADEFAARRRRGEAPSIFEYVAEYPQYAEEIEQLFPAVAMMEQLRVEEDSRWESARRRAKPFDPPERIGDFAILREIGRGGMGVVYEAEQRSLARRVAVKVLPEHLLLGHGGLARFQREAQTAARLRHTAIVPIFGVGEQDGLHYYVMPLVRGVGLDEVIAALRVAADPSEAKLPRGSRATGEQPDVGAGTGLPLEFTLQRTNEAKAEFGTLKRELQPPDRATAARRFLHLPDLGTVVQSLIAKKFPALQNGGHAAWTGESRYPIAADRCTTAARLGLQTARALEYAHAQGTLHRDIKPGNLLIDEEGNACLADFGLARAIEPNHAGGGEREVVGTPRYMAPEQLRGAADARSDIYGLGLTLYELLTLRLPAGVPPGGRPAARHAPPRPVPPRQLDRTIPRDLEAIVLKCLAHDPARRYPTAAALADDLRRFLDDRPVRARRASRLERSCRWCFRNPVLAAVSAMAALLMVALAVTATVGHVRTRTAYAETRQALGRAEATSGVALEVLEDLYLQLSPERVWIPTDSDPPGQVCACVGLRSARPAAPDQRDYIQVPPSDETASLLENLLVFYDRLAEQVGDDRQLMLQAAVATRRVGDIRQRLGQIDQAEGEYRKAIAKLDALGDVAGAEPKVYVELARCHNEIGNVRAARFEPRAAYEAHIEALKSLRSTASAQPACEEFRYELARTYFFLAGRHPGASATLRDRREERSVQRFARFALAEKQYRTRAIGLLEELAGKNPGAADYRFLLALCYRPLASAPEASRGSAAVSGRQRALEILEALKRRYPQMADYRYELAATYAWVHVGLFPWQEPSAASPATERALHKALDEARWLVDHNPTIPRFARSKALILAKLGAIGEEADRPAEAAAWFEQAFDAQAALVERFPDLPSHDRVLREFFRFRLAAHGLRPSDSAGPDTPAEAVALLETCVANLTALRGRRELAGDRLAASALRLAEDALERARRP